MITKNGSAVMLSLRRLVIAIPSGAQREKNSDITLECMTTKQVPSSLADTWLLDLDEPIYIRDDSIYVKNNLKYFLKTI